MIRALSVVALFAMLWALSLHDSASAQATRVTPGAGVVSLVTTGGTAVNALTGPANGCYIVNPLTATDQNLMAAEPLYVDPVTDALTSAHGTTVALAPGDKWSCAAFSTLPVSVNAATSGHQFTVVRW